MVEWLESVTGLNEEQQAVADGLAAVLKRLNPSQLDVTRCSAVLHGNGFHIVLAHRNGEYRIDIDADGNGESVVSYGLEHEHFRWEDADVGRVWPFPSDDHVQATLALVEYLLTGRVELHVWKRPFAIKTRSYWINDQGEAELFLRGGTVGPFFGWSRTPEVNRFDFT